MYTIYNPQRDEWTYFHKTYNPLPIINNETINKALFTLVEGERGIWESNSPPAQISPNETLFTSNIGK